MKELAAWLGVGSIILVAVVLASFAWQAVALWLAFIMFGIASSFFGKKEGE